MGCGYNTNGNYSNNIYENEIISNNKRKNYLVTIDSSGGDKILNQKRLKNQKKLQRKSRKTSRS